MVIKTQPILDSNTVHTDFKTCTPASRVFVEVPVIDLSAPSRGARIVEACKEFGFFKATSHSISLDFLARLESEAQAFFARSRLDKEDSGPPTPCGYGIKKIGPNGDVGWVEYLLFRANPNLDSAVPIPGISETLMGLVNEYVGAVQKMSRGVLEMVAEELGVEPVDRLSRMISDEKSDSYLRVNHYPSCSRIQELSNMELVGFGEHTDPQIMSVIRSNSTPGLEICLRDGTWVSVEADPASFFFIVGDSLQVDGDMITSYNRQMSIVMTNGKFLSVKHRVTANSEESRLSMVYFGGPTLGQTIAPLASVMEEGESSVYNEFTWSDYKKSAYMTRLGDDRVSLFQKY